MASICMEFWVHYVRHRPVYAMHPDHYTDGSVTEIETYDSCVVMLTVWINGPRHVKLCLREFPTRSDSKLACSATEASMMVDILVTETRDITLSRQRATKMLIRLCGCADWSAPLLFAYDIRHIFSWPGSLIFSCLLFYKRLNLFHAHKYF